MNMQYSLDQITLLPKAISTVEHRSDISLRDFEGKLPIFVSPMTCILDKGNFDTFNDSAFIPVYPVWYGEDVQYRLSLCKKGYWVAFTLNEFIDTFCKGERLRCVHKVLIDCADGHMSRLFEAVKEAKKHHDYTLTAMVGNIAHPETYLECCRAGVDYVRVGIGGGSGCTTSEQTGFHASMPYLLTEIRKLKDNGACKGLKTLTKIIADGGVNSLSRMVKCFALGADYVMMGRCFAECREACGTARKISDMWNWERHYYGQASKEGQLDRFGKVKGNPEGIDTWIDINYTLAEWTDKVEAVLRSALSYGGAFNMNEFIGNVKWDVQSDSEYLAYHK